MEDKYLSISDYASSKGVSTQAVYKQLKAHTEQLEGHIIKHEGKRWLDPEAVQILTDASSSSAPVLIETADKIKLDEVMNRNKDLADQLLMTQNKLVRAQETIIAMHQEKAQYEALVARNTLLLDDKEHTEQLLQNAEKENQQLKNDLEQAKKRTLWQRIRNK